jgi:diphthine synthase
MTLSFVGLGLGSVEYLTRGAEKALLSSEKVYLDTYTGYLSSELEEFLRNLLGERLIHADRKKLEDDLHEIVEEAKGKEIVIAAPGDPLIATTHISILLEAVKRGVSVRPRSMAFRYSRPPRATPAYRHTSSAEPSRFPEGRRTRFSRGVYQVVAQNEERGLHSLILLDTADGGLSASEAAEYLLRIEEKIGHGVFRRDRIVVVLANVGLRTAQKMCNALGELPRTTLQSPPHVLIFPGDLNFVEREALKMIASCDKELIDEYLPISASRQRARRYIDKTSRVVERIGRQPLDGESREILELASTYLYDSQSFLSSGRVEDSLIAISYAEGLLDCLRMLGRVSFEW